MKKSTLLEILRYPVLKNYPGSEDEAQDMIDDIAKAIMDEFDWIDFNDS